MTTALARRSPYTRHDHAAGARTATSPQLPDATSFGGYSQLHTGRPSSISESPGGNDAFCIRISLAASSRLSCTISDSTAGDVGGEDAAVGTGRRYRLAMALPCVAALALGAHACGDDTHATGDAATPPPPPAPPPTPLGELRASSAVAVLARTDEDGRVLDAEGDFETTGSTPEERAAGFLRAHGDAFGLDDPDAELEVIGTKEDPLGGVMVVLRRVVGDVPVLGAEVRVYLDARDHVRFLVAELPRDVGVSSTTPTIDATEAASAASDAVSLPVDATVAPSLVVWSDEPFVDRASPPVLAWRVRAGSGERVREVLVDAASAGVVASWAGAMSAAASWVYDGPSDSDAAVLVVYDDDDGTTREICPPMAQCPLPGEMLPSYCAADACPLPLDAPPPRITRGMIDDARTVRDQLATVYDYLRRTFSRDGVNGLGGITRAYITDTPSDRGANAFAIGSDDRGRPGIQIDRVLVGGLDTVAHEVGHEIIRLESEARGQPLDHGGFPGAINEALADMLASFVATEGKGLLGDDDPGLPPPSDPMYCLRVRNHDDPRSCNQPSHLAEKLPSTVAFDDGNTHGNSTIVSHALRLLVNGGTHARSEIVVRAIGEPKVARLWYRVVTTYLGGATGIPGLGSMFRVACRELARSRMLGFEIRDCGAVVNAFAAVGAGDIDSDEDSWPDVVDTCAHVFDPMQEDADGDGVGDACPRTGLDAGLVDGGTSRDAAPSDAGEVGRDAAGSFCPGVLPTDTHGNWPLWSQRGPSPSTGEASRVVTCAYRESPDAAGSDETFLAFWGTEPDVESTYGCVGPTLTSASASCSADVQAEVRSVGTGDGFEDAAERRFRETLLPIAARMAAPCLPEPRPLACTEGAMVTCPPTVDTSVGTMPLSRQDAFSPCPTSLGGNPQFSAQCFYASALCDDTLPLGNVQYFLTWAETPGSTLTVTNACSGMEGVFTLGAYHFYSAEKQASVAYAGPREPGLDAAARLLLSQLEPRSLRCP